MLPLLTVSCVVEVVSCSAPGNTGPPAPFLASHNSVYIDACLLLPTELNHLLQYKTGIRDFYLNILMPRRWQRRTKSPLSIVFSRLMGYLVLRPIIRVTAGLADIVLWLLNDVRAAVNICWSIHKAIVHFRS